MIRTLSKFLRNGLSHLKNRFVPVRYLYQFTYMCRDLGKRFPAAEVPPVTDEFHQLQSTGFVSTDLKIAPDKLEWIRNKAKERASVRKNSGYSTYPFFDLLEDEDFAHPDNPIVEAIFNEDLLKAAAWYFKGRPMLTRCFLAYHRPDPQQEWKQTQLWHFDSDDFRMLRAIIYLSDVSEGAGPFMFVSRNDSPRRPHLWSRRLTDEQFSQLSEKRKAKVHTFSGPIGSAMLIDSAQCLHYGGRATESDRLSLVITFTSRSPCNQMHPLIRRHRNTLYTFLRQQMPHLDPRLLQSLLK